MLLYSASVILFFILLATTKGESLELISVKAWSINSMAVSKLEPDSIRFQITGMVSFSILSMLRLFRILIMMFFRRCKK